jgi:hypothetical protein
LGYKALYIICLFWTSLALFAQTDDMGQMETQPSSVPPNERLHFAEHADIFFREELPVSTVPPPHLTPPSKIKARALPCGDGGWRICFEFPKPVFYRQCADACTLCLEFNQELANADFEEVQTALQFITLRFETGYNTLAIGTARPSVFCTQRLDNIFILDIYPNYNSTVFIPRVLKVARIRLLVEARLFGPAFCALKHFLTEYPEDRDGLVLLAELEEVLPRWQNAVAILSYLRLRLPYDTVVQAALHNAYYPHTSFVRFERQAVRYIDQAMEYIYRMSAEYIFNRTPEQFCYIGGNFEVHRGHIASGFITNLDGSTSGFKGTRYQGQLYLRKEVRDGTELTGIVYATEGVVMGGGVRYAFLVPCIQGRLALSADWHKPYWFTYETFVHFGREDRIYAEAEARYNRFFDQYLRGGVHRVGIEHVPDGWASVRLNGGAYGHFYVTPTADVALHYDFDAEYVFHNATRTNAAGEEFQPVPLSTYEFHTFKCEFVGLYGYWEVTSGVGYTQNRFGTGGLNANIGLRYRKPCPCGWEVAIGASQFPSTTVPGAIEQELNLELTLRY